MATANYTDLIAQVVAYSQRSDLASVIPDLVVFCEKKINRVLRDMNMEASRTTSPLTETTALPTDFVQLKTIVITWNGQKIVPTYVTPSQMDALKTTSTTQTGDPAYFTVRANNIEVYPAPSSTYTYSMTISYVLRLVPLATTATNWLLTDHFDVYLYGTLAEVAMYVRDDGLLARYKPLYEEAVGALKAHNIDRKFTKHLMVADTSMPGLSGRSFGSIETGFA